MKNNACYESTTAKNELLNIYQCQYRNKNYKLQTWILVYLNIFVTENVCKQSCAAIVSILNLYYPHGQE